MNKTFELTDPKIKTARIADKIKGQINKYIKRERKKILPDGFDFWDFDCCFGDTEDTKKSIHISEISRSIDETIARDLKSFYIELHSNPKKRNKKPESPIESKSPQDLKAN